MLAKNYAIEGYRILDVLGVGGFGITYVAVDETLEEKVAIKEFVPAGIAYHKGNAVEPVSRALQGNYERLLKDFLTESRHIARIRQANVVRVRRCFKCNGTAYLVMDYEDGEDFQAYLQRLGRPPTEAELLRIIAPLLDGLQAVHATGLVHRDIKPSNIFIRHGDGSPVLLDFGAARQDDASHFTAILTSGYAPIEQYEEGPCQGPWTDIYGMAAVFYRALTGNKPPSALSRLALDRMVPVTEAVVGLYSETLLRGIDSGLAVLPEKRPQSVADWRAGWFGDTTMRPSPAPLAPPETPVVPAELEPAPMTRDTPVDRDITMRHSVSDTEAIGEPAGSPPIEPPAIDLAPIDLAEPAPLRPVLVRVFPAPTADHDDRPRRFDFVRPSLEILGFAAISGFVAVVVSNIILRALFHDQTLTILLISTLFSGATATGIVLCSRETNLYSAARGGLASALISFLLFVVIFGKYL